MKEKELTQRSRIKVLEAEEQAGRAYLAELMWENGGAERWAKRFVGAVIMVSSLASCFPIDWVKHAERLMNK